MRSCTFDIETSDLAAVGAGFVLCAVVKPYDDEPIVFRYDKFKCKPGKETKMMAALIDVLHNFDFWVGHNIERFDYNYLKTRALILGLPWNEHPFLYDTLKAYRRHGFLSRPNGFGKPSAGLATVGDILGVKEKENGKTAVHPREWWKAIWDKGPEQKEALDEIVDHCIRDVKLNERVFDALWPTDRGVNLRRS